jgi:hypothetical protein
VGLRGGRGPWRGEGWVGGGVSGGRGEWGKGLVGGKKETNGRTDGHFYDVIFSKIWRRTYVADALTSRTHLRQIYDIRTNVVFTLSGTYVVFFTFSRTYVVFLALCRTNVDPNVGGTNDVLHCRKNVGSILRLSQKTLGILKLLIKEYLNLMKFWKNNF